MSFVAAVAVADVLNAFGPAELIALKWPNDPLIDGRKAGGILVESGRLADERLWLAVGCGVNLAWAPQAVERPATCLAEHLAGAPPTPREALTLLVSAMESWRDVWERQGFAPIARAWTRRAHGLGSPCTARLTHETISGIAEGLEDDGALRLRLEDGSVRRVTAGDVFF
jgi:BirA family biotin operon repressor/biotin-[acetyl-CoA-carboxylase] ligase